MAFFSGCTINVTSLIFVLSREYFVVRRANSIASFVPTRVSRSPIIIHMDRPARFWAIEFTDKEFTKGVFSVPLNSRKASKLVTGAKTAVALIHGSAAAT